MASWPSTVDAQERTRRLIDLFLVSVLLDAGAGSKWQYRSKESGKVYRRSEGLAVASLEMFKAGLFSSDPNEPCQVDSAGLKRLDMNTLARGLQVMDTNPLDGLEGRSGLLMKLGSALQNQEVFGLEARPGNMLGMYCRASPWAPINIDQITYFHIPLPKPLPYPLSHSQPFGIPSWTALLPSGPLPVPKSTVYLSATHGRVPLCHPIQHTRGRTSSPSTNSRSGWPTRSWLR
jgi:hypothetical protein